MPVIERVWRSGSRKVKRTAWGYTVQIAGKQVRKFNAAWSKQDAQDALAARILERDVPAPPPVAPAVTFKAMTERYLKEKEAAKKKTIRADKNIIARLLAAFGADTPLTEITAPKIAEYRLARLTIVSTKTGKRLEPGSVNRELQVLRGLLRMAAGEECGYLAKVPTVKMEKEPEGRLRYLSEDEAARLLAECRKAAEHPVSTNRSPRLHALVVVAIHTGMRRGELCGLVWNRVDFSRGVVQLDKTKAGRRREIPMNRDVYDALSELPKGGERVFPSTYRTAFEHAVIRAKIHDFTFHGLRHTFASWLTMKGRPLKEVSELLGHSSVKMTERYAHLAPERLREAVAVLEGFSTTAAHEARAETPVLVTSENHGQVAGESIRRRDSSARH
jgi:integrase